MSNTPQQSEYQLLSLVASEIESSTREFADALAVVGVKRRAHIRNAYSDQINDRDLGAHILEDWYAGATEDVVAAAYSDGYQQAVNDIHTLIHAYYKGLQ